MVTLPWSLSAHNQIPFRDAAMHDEHASGRHTHGLLVYLIFIRSYVAHLIESTPFITLEYSSGRYFSR